MKSVFALSAFATVASATVGLLVPFYEYPYGDVATAEWTALVKAVDDNPKLPFYVVIDIDNGAPFSPDPPAGLKDYASWIDALNQRDNAHPIAYLRTNFSRRAVDTVQSGIDQYAAWTTSAGWTSNASQYDVHVEGIFYDEINTDPTYLDYNTQITKYAKNALGSASTIVLNPGIAVRPGSESLLSLADTIVQMETCYTNSSGATDPDGYERCAPNTYMPFTQSFLDSVVGTDTTAVKATHSSIIIHDYYETYDPFVEATLAELQNSVDITVAANVHSLYVSLFGYTGNFTADVVNIGNVAKFASAAQNLS